MSERFLVKGLGGKRKLRGAIEIKGAKNAALKAMAAALLFRDPLTIRNAPIIEDVNRMADLLIYGGAKIDRRQNGTLIIDSRPFSKTALSFDIAKRFRASIVLSGPILARYGEVSFPHPGGCVIGERPIDSFIDGFKKMGASVKVHRGLYRVYAPKKQLHGATLFFQSRSVTATETFMMAGVLAKGTTIIKNAACEPEIVHLGNFLRACGASIEGAGTPTITIKGGKLLSTRGKHYITPPDRIETGSFLILSALAARDVLITRCIPEEVEYLIEVLKNAGVPIIIGKNTLRVVCDKKNSAFRSINVKTNTYPGFPTDLQSLISIFFTQTSGESIVFETIFEGRLGYMEQLVRMGADIKMMDPHRILVKGPAQLRGRSMESPDLRAGLAFIIAAVVAKGESVIHNVYNIDRGYEKIEERLSKIGVDIVRVKD